MTALLVALAGALGVLARHGLSSALGGVWTIVAINVVGSFALGLLVASEWGSSQTRLALGGGFLGGFTTFSTFSVQIVQDVDGGEGGRALTYLAASVGLGITAAAAGFALGRAARA